MLMTVMTGNKNYTYNYEEACKRDKGEEHKPNRKCDGKCKGLLQGEFGLNDTERDARYVHI